MAQPIKRATETVIDFKIKHAVATVLATKLKHAHASNFKSALRIKQSQALGVGSINIKKCIDTETSFCRDLAKSVSKLIPPFLIRSAFAFLRYHLIPVIFTNRALIRSFKNSENTEE